MKKIFFLASALLASLTISAEVIKLDLSEPEVAKQFSFGENGLWVSTCDSTVQVFESQLFAFSKSLDGRSYGGTSWNGFTVSKATEGAYESNLAKGGIKGEGTNYVLGYYSEWWLIDPKNEDATSSNMILFADSNAYYPRYVYLNNVLVSYNDIMNGNAFGAHKFAKGDKFGVKIEGLDEDYYPTDESVTYLLADYTSEDSTKWYVNTEWEKVDLSALGKVYGVQFTVFSTDQGMYGTNTATYFALDGLTVTTTADEPTEPVVASFEDIKLAKADTCWQGAYTPAIGWNNWTSGTYNFMTYYSVSEYGTYYSAFTVTNDTANTSTGMLEPYRSASGGAYAGENFAVWNMNYYGLDTVSFDAQVVPGMFVNNTAYAVSSMCKGDGFAKKFGKDDWFKLTINGYLDGEAVNKEVVVELAVDGKYINNWTFVDLSELGEIDAITFNMSSSDNSNGYMNTPAYFALDNFGSEMPMGYVVPEMAEFDLSEGIENTNAAVKAVKVIRNGQVVILRGEKVFNVLGAEL